MTGFQGARARIENIEILSDGWARLGRYRLVYRRADGREEAQTREVFDHGDAATILLRDPSRDMVLLTRQFRLPAFVTGDGGGMLLETPAGLLDADHPEDAIRREVEEETGYRIRDIRPLFLAYTSPGSATERVHFFAADYAASDRVGAGGGLAEEGEDIEVVELSLDEALKMIGRGGIIDAKTILLLYHAALLRAGVAL